jgi:hypothetical protein
MAPSKDDLATALARSAQGAIEDSVHLWNAHSCCVAMAVATTLSPCSASLEVPLHEAGRVFSTELLEEELVVPDGRTWLNTKIIDLSIDEMPRRLRDFVLRDDQGKAFFCLGDGLRRMLKPRQRDTKSRFNFPSAILDTRERSHPRHVHRPQSCRARRGDRIRLSTLVGGHTSRPSRHHDRGRCSTASRRENRLKGCPPTHNKEAIDESGQESIGWSCNGAHPTQTAKSKTSQQGGDVQRNVELRPSFGLCISSEHHGRLADPISARPCCCLSAYS